MKTQIEKIWLLSLLGLFIMGCSTPAGPATIPPITTAACSSINTSFQQLYSNVLTLPGYTNSVTYDTEVHEYQFKMNTNINICSIGYQSQPAIASVPYKIEILNSANVVIYSGNLIFSSVTTSYVPITPVPIVAGQIYTMRRTITLVAAGGNFSNIIGRLVSQPGALTTFPQTFGAMTITGANFYQNGGPLVNRGIPFIDFSY